jgi:hypothetical protein
MKFAKIKFSKDIYNMFVKIISMKLEEIHEEFEGMEPSD